jgi:hypothetical protein
MKTYKENDKGEKLGKISSMNTMKMHEGRWKLWKMRSTSKTMGRTRTTYKNIGPKTGKTLTTMKRDEKHNE